MGRKKKGGAETAIMSARVPVDLLKKAEELGLNKSEIVRKALYENLTISAEKEYLRIQIDYHYKEIEDLSKRLDDLEKVESKADKELWDTCIERIRSRYLATDKIDGEMVVGWSNRLGVSVKELEAVIAKEIEFL